MYNGMWNSRTIFFNSIIEGDIYNNSIIDFYYTYFSGSVSSQSVSQNNPLGSILLNEDYTLPNDSQGIDAGIVYFEEDGDILLELDDDYYYGPAPDIGAFESLWTAYFGCSDEQAVSYNPNLEFIDDQISADEAVDKINAELAKF